MIAGVIYYFRLFIQLAYPIHDAITSYQKYDEQKFPLILKYFTLLTGLLSLEFLMRLIFKGLFLEISLLALIFVLVAKDYALSELIFDSFLNKMSFLGDSKLEKLIAIIEIKINLLFDFINTQAILPMKHFISKMARQFLAKKLLVDENKEEPKNQKETKKSN